MDYQKARRLLGGGKSGVDEWNHWRKNFKIMAFRDLNLGAANLQGADLGDIGFYGANFANADLRDAKFSMSSFHGVCFDNADLTTALLDDCYFEGSSLCGCNLQGARLNDSIIGADLNHANLADAFLLRATISGSLAGCNLRKADLCGAILNGINLSDSDLRGAHLSGSSLQHAILTRARLEGAYLTDSNLHRAHLDDVNLSGAHMRDANLSWANLKRADLHQADLYRANLRGADLSGACLSGANLDAAALIDTTLAEADLTGCSVYGVSAWHLDLRNSKQSNLVISGKDEARITVDSIEVAQFIHLLLRNEKIREIIDTITSKVVLVLGRFTSERKPILEIMKEALRDRGFCPVLCDFDFSPARDTQEVITTLARLSRFVVADISDPRSVPQELVSIVESLPSVPIQPIISRGSKPWGMFDHLRKYPWVLAPYEYEGAPQLLASIDEFIVGPAEHRLGNLGPEHR